MLRLLTIAILVLALASAASAATITSTTPTPPAPKIKLTVAQKKLLWATVNSCNTPHHPDRIGIAGSMPVVKKANGLYMRFRLQYRDESTTTFKPVPGSDADSFWEIVDPGTGKARQAGHNFTIAAPKTGSYTLRAQISYQWRRGDKVLLSANRFTAAGHPNTKAAKPKRFSAAACTIK